MSRLIQKLDIHLSHLGFAAGGIVLSLVVAVLIEPWPLRWAIGLVAGLIIGVALGYTANKPE